MTPTTQTPAMRLRAARGARTFREMAALLGVPHTTYQGWELGSEPSIAKALEVESALGVRIWTHVAPAPDGPVVVREGFDQRAEEG